MAMHTRCPSCGATGVKCYDSRASTQKSVLRRRNYACAACGDRFYTDEVVRRVGDEVVMADPRQVASDFVQDVEREVRRLAQAAYGNVSGTLAHPGPRNTAP